MDRWRGGAGRIGGGEGACSAWTEGGSRDIIYVIYFFTVPPVGCRRPFSLAVSVRHRLSVIRRRSTLTGRFYRFVAAIISYYRKTGAKTSSALPLATTSGHPCTRQHSRVCWRVPESAVFRIGSRGRCRAGDKPRPVRPPWSSHATTPARCTTIGRHSPSRAAR